MNWRKLDGFTKGCLEAACHANAYYYDEETGELTFDDDANIDELSEKAIAEIAADCEEFQREVAELLDECDSRQAGIDFWLTRNRHGAGYWDGDYDEEIGRKLTEASHTYGGRMLILNSETGEYELFSA